MGELAKSVSFYFSFAGVNQEKVFCSFNSECGFMAKLVYNCSIAEIQGVKYFCTIYFLEMYL